MRYLSASIQLSHTRTQWSDHDEHTKQETVTRSPFDAHEELMPEQSSSPPQLSSSQRAKQIAEQALGQLSEQLDAGNSDQLDAYIQAMSRFHKYSFSNIMLIVSQRPEASQVAGFHTWRKLGRTVKRGEKGIAIFAPMKLKPRGDQTYQDPDDHAPQLFFRVVYVFDISQTEGEPLPEPARVSGDPGDHLGSLLIAARSAGITVEFSQDLGGADGCSKGGSILLRAGMPPAEQFSVLAHEWAHEILHQNKDAPRPSKTVRETEAEAVAFVVSQAIGLVTGPAASDYIRLYNGDTETLTTSLDRIQRAACVIIEAIEESRQQKYCPALVLSHAVEQSKTR